MVLLRIEDKIDCSRRRPVVPPALFLPVGDAHNLSTLRTMRLLRMQIPGCSKDRGVAGRSFMKFVVEKARPVNVNELYDLMSSESVLSKWKYLCKRLQPGMKLRDMCSEK